MGRTYQLFLLTILAFLSINCSEASSNTTFSDLELYKLSGEPYVIPKGHRGYVFYVLDPRYDCTPCISDLSYWDQFGEIYENIYFATIQYETKGDYKQDNNKLFRHITYRGIRLISRQNQFQKKYHLEEGPCIISFNDSGEIVNITRFEDFAIGSKGFFFHNLLARLNN